MPFSDDVKAVPRKVLPFIYVLDTSGSMIGKKIAELNDAMKETFKILKEISADNADVEIRLNVLAFSSGSKWIYPTLISLEDCYWNDMKAGGITDLGDALIELNQNLSRSAMLESQNGFKIPVILFLSDGQPTDDWESALLRINEQNTWFRHATKIAVAFGEDSDTEILSKVVGSYRNGTTVPNTEAVIHTDDISILKKMIRIVSTTASMVNSSCVSNNGFDNAAVIVEQVREELSDAKKEPIYTVKDSTKKTSTSNDGWGDSDTW